MRHPVRLSVLSWLLAPILIAGPLTVAPAQADPGQAPPRLRIGITGLKSASDNLHKLDTYRNALLKAGAEPIPLYYGSPVLAADIDGILFAGGEDVNPALYGEKPDPTVAINGPRDDSEMAQAESALEQGIPILGICRGSQLLNVRLGGSLVQDIPSQVPGALPHQAGNLHQITLTPGTQLAETVGLTTMRVNSYHHQSVKTLAKGLRLTAVSDDGIIEGWEAIPGGPIHSPVSGVQFHPEKPDFPMPSISQRIFARFLLSAQYFAAQKSARVRVK